MGGETQSLAPHTALIDEGKQAIVKGSKSFSMASFFFNKEEKEAAWLLYSWCRFVDDEIDQAGSTEDALQKVKEVEQRTRAALENPDLEVGPYRSLGLIAKNYQMNHKYPLDLIRGMKMDVEGAKIKDQDQLLDYCYCVAGTVGLMMCSVMGVRSEKAYPHALAMGQAMQLTNIARDIADDLKINRIYFPRTWLAENGLTEESFPKSKQQWIPLTEKLLDLADQSYQYGIAGLQFLNFRSAWAVIIAAYIYRAIGHKIRKNISLAHQQRTIVSRSEKFMLAGLATLKLLTLRLLRLASLN